MRHLPLIACALLAGCATTGARTPGDPYEGFNRAVWGVNRGIDKVVLKPAAKGYRFITPAPARRGISRVFSNLSEPWSAINALLQGKPRRALNSLGRFVVNTTIGVGGLADHATGFGLKPTPEDFGQTLARWGVKSSAYLVLPVLGPSTVRDGVGTGVAFFGDPYRICLRDCGLPHGVPFAVTALETVDTRAQLIDAGADAFLDSSADSYATARSAFLQRRQAQLDDRDGDTATPGAGTSDDAALDAAVKEIDEEQGQTTPAAPAATPEPAPPPAPRQDTPTPATPKPL